MKRLSLVVAIFSFTVACRKSESSNTLPSPDSSVAMSTTNMASEGHVQPPPESPAAPLPDVPPLNAGVVLRLSVELIQLRAVKVQAETNLPDSTELILTVREPGDFGISYDSNTAVQKGRFSVIEAGPNNVGLLDGEYIAEILMPIPTSQPETVQTILGDGRGLKGPLVKKGNIGITVFSSTKFLVGENREAAMAAGQERRRATKAFVQGALKQYQQVVQRGRTADRSDFVSCMARAREDWASLDPYKNKLEQMALPIPGVSSLRTAWLFTHNCAACVSDFIQDCNDASNELQEAWDEIKIGKLRLCEL